MDDANFQVASKQIKTKLNVHLDSTGKLLQSVTTPFLLCVALSHRAFVILNTPSIPSCQAVRRDTKGKQPCGES